MLPAYAGMIPALTSAIRRAFRAPRVCGDDPVPYAFMWTAIGCSPRMRG